MSNCQIVFKINVSENIFRKPKEKFVNDEIEKRNVTDVTKDDYDDDDDERVEDREDLDDSARAESIVSITRNQI